jgi:hypothetical protein
VVVVIVMVVGPVVVMCCICGDGGYCALKVACSVANLAITFEAGLPVRNSEFEHRTLV